jgi:hypothetical protein
MSMLSQHKLLGPVTGLAGPRSVPLLDVPASGPSGTREPWAAVVATGPGDNDARSSPGPGEPS